MARAYMRRQKINPSRFFPYRIYLEVKARAPFLDG